MRLIDAVREDAERQYWPPRLFALVLDRMEEMGYDLFSVMPRRGWPYCDASS